MTTQDLQLKKEAGNLCARLRRLHWDLTRFPDFSNDADRVKRIMDKAWLRYARRTPVGL